MVRNSFIKPASHRISHLTGERCGSKLDRSHQCGTADNAVRGRLVFANSIYLLMHPLSPYKAHEFFHRADLAFKFTPLRLILVTFIPAGNLVPHIDLPNAKRRHNTDDRRDNSTNKDRMQRLLITRSRGVAIYWLQVPDVVRGLPNL